MDLSPRTTTYESGSNQGFIVKPQDITEVGCTLDLALFPSAASGPIPAGTPLGKVTASGLYGPYSGGANRTDEVQTIALTGSPTGGTFIPSPFAIAATAAWNVGDTVAQAQAKVDAVTALAGKVKVGGAPGAWTLTAIGSAADTDQPTTTIASKSLTGGSSPDVTVSTGTAGGAETSSDGRQVFAGVVFDDVPTHSKSSGHVGASRIVLGAIYEAKLPTPIDSAAKADMPSIAFV